MSKPMPEFDVRFYTNVETATNRIKKYAPNIEEVKKEYPKFGNVVIVNGEQSIEDVFKELLEKVGDGSSN